MRKHMQLSVWISWQFVFKSTHGYKNVWVFFGGRSCSLLQRRIEKQLKSNFVRRYWVLPGLCNCWLSGWWSILILNWDKDGSCRGRIGIWMWASGFDVGHIGFVWVYEPGPTTLFKYFTDHPSPSIPWRFHRFDRLGERTIDVLFLSPFRYISCDVIPEKRKDAEFNT